MRELVALCDGHETCLMQPPALVRMWHQCRLSSPLCLTILIGLPTWSWKETPGTSLLFSAEESSRSNSQATNPSQHLDLSGLALKATFETLFVAFVTSPSPPSSLALLTSVQLATPQETYLRLSSLPLGSFLTAAHFWIPPFTAA